jgi:hypothetical protein
MPWWSPEEEQSPQSRIGASRRPVESPPEEAQRIRVPRRRFPRPSGATVFVVLMALLVVGLPAFITITVLSDVDDAFDGGGGGGGGGGSGDEPSLVRPDRFRPALEKVKEEAGSEGSVIAFRLDPERLSAVIRRSDGTGAVVIVERDLDERVLPAGQGGGRGLSLNRIDPAVPDRLARRVAERLGRPVDDLSYLALTAIPTNRTGGTWSVFFKSGTFYVADLDGSNLTRPGQ